MCLAPVAVILLYSIIHRLPLIDKGDILLSPLELVLVLLFWLLEVPCRVREAVEIRIGFAVVFVILVSTLMPGGSNGIEFEDA